MTMYSAKGNRFRHWTFTVLLLSCISATVLGKCQQHHDCAEGKCCEGECQNRDFCDGSCGYNGDCDIAKGEKCYHGTCTEVTMSPGRCHNRYDCGRGEICEYESCIAIGDNNPSHPESGGESINPIVVVVVIVSVVGILLGIGIFMCCNYERQLKARRRRAATRRARRRSSQGISLRRQSSPGIMAALPRASTTPPRAPPAYEEISRDQGGLPGVPPPSYDEAINDPSV